MAIFNPEVQQGWSHDPNFFKYSEPISTPQFKGNTAADTSTGTALTAVGQGIDGIVGLADTAVKDTIKQDVYNRVDKEREDFTTALNTVRDAQRGSVVPPAVQTSSGSTALSLTDQQPSQPVPAAIETGTNKVDALQAALVNGKINDTYYTQRLNSIAKDLRTQYPGYREYIDQRIAETTGINPANAYIRNLMEDINRASATRDKARDALETEMHNAVGQGVGGTDANGKPIPGLPQADIVYKAWKNGIISDDDARAWLYKANHGMWAIKQQDAQRANMKGTKEEIADQRTKDFTRETGAAIDNAFHVQTMITGTNTPQGILDFVGKVASGQKQATDAQFEQLATLVLQQKNAFMAQMKARSNQLVNGNSYASDIGADKTDAIIKSQASAYDLVYDALKNKDAGAAYSHMNQARAILDDTKANVLQTDIGQYAAKSKVFLDTMGPNWTGLVVQDALRKDMDVKARALFNDNALDARIQPNLAATGVPTTASDHIEAAKKAKVKDPKYYDSVIGLVDDLRNPNAPDADKANVIRYFYSPQGQNLLRNFNQDYVDPITHKTVPGKYAVWSRLTSPDITASVAKMAKSDEAAGNMYRNWVESVGRDLFGDSVRNLNHFTGHDNLFFDYDSKYHQLTLRDKEGALSPIVGQDSRTTTNRPPPDSYIWQVKKQVDQVNTVLRNLSTMQQSFGGDPDAYALRIIQEYGADLNGNYSGLPKAIADAIAASRKPQKRLEDTFGDFNKK